MEKDKHALTVEELTDLDAFCVKRREPKYLENLIYEIMDDIRINDPRFNKLHK